MYVCMPDWSSKQHTNNGDFQDYVANLLKCMWRPQTFICVKRGVREVVPTLPTTIKNRPIRCPITPSSLQLINPYNSLIPKTHVSLWLIHPYYSFIVAIVAITEQRNSWAQSGKNKGPTRPVCIGMVQPPATFHTFSPESPTTWGQSSLSLKDAASLPYAIPKPTGAPLLAAPPAPPHHCPPRIVLLRSRFQPPHPPSSSVHGDLGDFKPAEGC